MVAVARTRQRDVQLPGLGTLMDQCLAVGLPVASACSGRGACGKCVLTILEGGESLGPISVHEAEVLQKNAAPPGSRLGCQSALLHPQADLLITTGYW